MLPGPAVPRRRGTTRSASCLRALATGAVPVPASWYSIRSPAGEQIAGADRFQRGETWPIFMAGVLAMLVLNLLAAAHLKRSPLLAPDRTVGSCVAHGRTLAMSGAARVRVLERSAQSALPVPASRALPPRVLLGSASKAPRPLPCFVHPPYPGLRLPVLSRLACGDRYTAMSSASLKIPSSSPLTWGSCGQRAALSIESPGGQDR